MISRRLLRVKVLQMLYAFYKNENRTINNVEKELFFSIGKSYDLFHYLLLLIVEMQKISNKKIEIGKEKLVPTEEDLNPNTKFVDNLLIKQLSENIQLNSYAERNTITWSDQEDYIKLLYQQLIASDLYKNYMNTEENSYDIDKKFVEKFYLKFLAENEEFYTMLEEKSIYWNDESEFIISMIASHIKNYNETDDQNLALPSLFKNADDEDFVRDLFRKSLLNHSDNIALIEQNTKNWELDRMAFIDTLIMEMALVELTCFKNIPINVSLNEYLELSKFYSTPKSYLFINGILDKITKQLISEKKIKKAGRGLINQSTPDANTKK